MVVQQISIWSDGFRDPVAKALAGGTRLAIWHQIPWAGGEHEWFLLCQLPGLDEILSRGRMASAFTVYEWLDVRLPHHVDQEWLVLAHDALEKDEPNHLLLLHPSSQSSEPVVELVELTFSDDLQSGVRL